MTLWVGGGGGGGERGVELGGNKQQIRNNL